MQRILIHPDYLATMEADTTPRTESITERKSENWHHRKGGHPTRVVTVQSYCYCERQGPACGREQGRNTLTFLWCPSTCWCLPSADSSKKPTCQGTQPPTGVCLQAENLYEEAEWKTTLGNTFPLSKFQFSDLWDSTYSIIVALKFLLSAFHSEKFQSYEEFKRLVL